MTDRVVLLHGIARSSRAMEPLAQALRTAGYDVRNLDYPARRHDIATLASWVADRIEPWDLAASVEDRPLHFVTHSLGGLVADALIRARRPVRLGRVVMLGPPALGSEIADRLVHHAWYRRVFGPAGRELTTVAKAAHIPADYPLGIIAGTRALDPLGWALLPKPNDGKVSVARTRFAGHADHLVLPVTHALMMRSDLVIAKTLAFLAAGRF